MTLNIRTNLQSLDIQRSLSNTTNGLQTAYQRLSSGMRINSVADDAAGLAIAETLKADSRVASVAVRNAGDGISIVSIAEGSMSQVTSILSRLAELAEQSANGVYANAQRSALALEFGALMSQIEQIAHTTEFNGQRLLSGGAGFSLLVGFNGTSLSQIVVPGVQATLASLGLAALNSSVPLYSIMAVEDVESKSSARLALDAINGAITSMTRSRGTLGAVESRLEAAINNLKVERDTITGAEGRIRDADIAAESAELTRLTILQQAGTAVLAQANQQPQLVLQLLG